MTHYIALVHKEPDSGFGASFPDLPGVVAAGDTIDQVIAEAAEVLDFAADDWEKLNNRPFPLPRTIDELRDDAEFRSNSSDAIVAAIPFRKMRYKPAAE